MYSFQETGSISLVLITTYDAIKSESIVSLKMFFLSSILSLAVISMVYRLVVDNITESFCQCSFPGSVPDLLNQSLYFNNLPIACTHTKDKECPGLCPIPSSITDTINKT